MVILNTTFVTHESVRNDFLRWLREVYLVSARSSGFFGSPTVARVLTRLEPDTESIAVQLPANSLDDARRWHDETAAILRDDMHARWGERLMFFSTYMELLPAE